MSDVARIMELLKVIDDKNEEIERLRAALRQIADLDAKGYTPAEDMRDIAKEALTR